MDPEATDEEIKKRFRQVFSFCIQSPWKGSRSAVEIVWLGVGRRKMVVKVYLGRGGVYFWQKFIQQCLYQQEESCSSVPGPCVIGCFACAVCDGAIAN